MFGLRVWPAVFIGSLAVNMWVSFDGVAAGNAQVIAAAVLIAFGASAQAIASAWLLKRLNVWPDALKNGTTVTRLMVIGGPVGCAINATVGSVSLLAMGLIDTSEFNFNWLNWWVGDAIGVITLAPLLLVWSGLMGEFWRRRAGTLTLPIAVALVVVVSLFLMASNREQSRIESEFNDTAYNIEGAIKTRLNTIIAALGGIQSLFASSHNVDAYEFRMFTRRALRDNPELLALSFNRQVDHAQRSLFEEAEYPASRLRFTERNDQGQLIDASVRDRYIVVQYIEPLAKNRDALGLDTAFDLSRLKAMQQARNTGEATATGALHLVQAEQSEPGILIAAPIYDSGSTPAALSDRMENISGYAVGVVLVGRLLETAIAGLRLDHVSLELYDENAPAGDQLLTTWGGSEGVEKLLSTDLHIPFAGRQWRFKVDADAEYVAEHRASGLAMILAAGLSLCGLLGAFTLTLAGNERREALRASMDSLTGLANRGEFEQRLESAIRTCKTTGAQHAFAYCDLDKFKLVNDTAGHQAGDELLKLVARLFYSRLRNRDTVARLGGDEFGLLMEHCPIDKAREIAEQVCADIRDLHFTWKNQVFQIGASIGVVAVTPATHDVNEAMTSADYACYAAKNQGRNQVYVDRRDSAQGRRRKTELQRLADLRKKLEDDELMLYTQPVWAIDGLQKKPVAHEVLLRLSDANGDIIAPAGIIAVAERYGIMTDVDRWVISNVLSDIERFTAQGAIISINLSANCFDDDLLGEFVCSEIQRSGVDPKDVCFEITETAAMSNPDSAQHFIQFLKQLGCRVALDDFGSGISSFRCLNSLPVDFLKIDGALVQGIVTDPASRAMVTAIQQIASTLNMATIAEWVSDRSVIAPLQEIGVNFVQGFALGKPVPIAESSGWNHTDEAGKVVELESV